jgi:predicted GNAT family acetyltransferase
VLFADRRTLRDSRMSSHDTSPVAVRHNPAEHRFEATVEGKLCVADYDLSKGEIAFTHTFVPPELRGRGIAEALVRTALDYAKAESLRVIPACSYVATFIRRHREYVQLTT